MTNYFVVTSLDAIFGLNNSFQSVLNGLVDLNDICDALQRDLHQQKGRSLIYIFMGPLPCMGQNVTIYPFQNSKFAHKYVHIW